MGKKKNVVSVVFNEDFRQHLDADVLAITDRNFWERFSGNQNTNPLWRFRGSRIVSTFDLGLECVDILAEANTNDDVISWAQSTYGEENNVVIAGQSIHGA